MARLPLALLFLSSEAVAGLGIRHPRRTEEAAEPGCGGPSELHVVAYSSRSTHDLFSCWTNYITEMMSADSSITYTLHAQLQGGAGVKEADTADPNQLRFGDSTFRRGVESRLQYLLSTLEETAGDSDDACSAPTVLFTDLDVMPLRPYSELLPLMSDKTMVFMKEPSGSRSGFVNAGFMLMRNRRSVRRLISRVLRLMDNKATDDMWNDQLLLNRELGCSQVVRSDGQPSDVCADQRRDVVGDWGTFSEEVVAGHVPGVSERTVAYHAVFAPNAHEKIVKLADVYARSKTSMIQFCMPAAKRA